MTKPETPIEIAVWSRDMLLPIVRRSGRLTTGARTDGSLRLLVLDRPSWRLRHWTPFNALGGDEAASPGYRHAVERQRRRTIMPYGFDVRFEGRQVVCLLWSLAGEQELVQFEHGRWQDELSRYAGLSGLS